MKHQVDYDSVAPKYDRRYHDHTYPDTWHAILDHIVDRVGLDVLEVGCGTGHWLGELRAHGAQVAGLDHSAGMLARARERLPGVRLELGTAEALPWADAAVDRVICINALHHFPDKPGFIREAFRVLRPGGRVLIVRHARAFEVRSGCAASLPPNGR